MVHYRRLLFFFFISFIIVKPSFCHESLTLAVSSNFLSTMKLIKREFEKTHQVKLSLVSGPTGLLYAQIKRGAPIDLFFAADEERPKKLEEEGLIQPGGHFVYAYGALVLVRKKGSSLPLNLELLKKKKAPFPFFVIANPKTAPFGKAGVEVLKSYGLYDVAESKGKLVRGENVGKAFYYVSKGHADLGIVSKSFVVDKKKGSTIGGFLEISSSRYGPIKQTAVVLKGKMKKSVKSFLRFLSSEKARSIIKKMGYGLPKVKGPTT